MTAEEILKLRSRLVVATNLQQKRGQVQELLGAMRKASEDADLIVSMRDPAMRDVFCSLTVSDLRDVLTDRLVVIDQRLAAELAAL